MFQVVESRNDLKKESPRDVTLRIFQCALTAKIVIKGRENSNPFKLLECDTDHVTRKIGPL